MRRVAVGIALLLVTMPAGTASAEPICGKRRVVTVAANSSAVVFYTRSRLYRDSLGPDSTYYVCRRRGNRVFELRFRGQGGSQEAIRDLSLAGRYVGYIEDSGSSAIGFSDLYRLDVRSGRLRRIASATSGDYRGAYIRQYVLGRSGALAWIRDSYDGPAQTLRLEKLDRDGRAVLDPGPVIDAGSLAITATGRRVYWSSNGQPRQAALR